MVLYDVLRPAGLAQLLLSYPIFILSQAKDVTKQNVPKAQDEAAAYKSCYVILPGRTLCVYHNNRYSSNASFQIKS